ncbi:MAG: fibronectin type III domain-containing protein, partial [Acidobacteriaceae bacterium]|nr:fibronectin type III domain-containing protein [Acidobacteriaceae bacterium]
MLLFAAMVFAGIGLVACAGYAGIAGQTSPSPTPTAPPASPSPTPTPNSPTPTPDTPTPTPPEGCTVAPDAPTSLTATATTSSSITLSWTSDATEGCPETYAVTVLQNGEPVDAGVAITGTTAVITGLDASTEYSFTVVATNTVGDSDPSEALDVSTSALTCALPDAPTGLAYSSLTATSVTLSWDAVDLPANCSTMKYTVYESGSAITSATNLTDTTVDLSGLTPGETYEYTVVATDDAGDSDPSDALSVSTPATCAAAPAPPANLVTVGATSNAATLSWDAVEPPASCSVTYSVYVDGGAAPVVSGLTAPATTITGLDPDMEHSITVAADDEYGSASSASLPATTTADPTPAGYNLDALGIPQYTCSTNYFVSPDGDDANDGLTPATPWLTIGDRSDASTVGNDYLHGWGILSGGGVCVNLLDGEYDIANLIMIDNASSSGTENSPTGYTVFRAVNPHGAVIKLTGTGTMIYPTGNYNIYDGMEIDGTGTTNAACFWGGGGGSQNNHHIVYENMYIHGCGRAALRIQEAGYIWVVNNVLAGNEIATGGNAEGAIFEMPGGDIATNQSLADTTFTPNAADDALTNGTIIFAFNS